MLPVPLMNIINGGAHADNGVDIQEFMVLPIGAESFAEALRWGAETFHALNADLQRRASRPASATRAALPRARISAPALDFIVEHRKAGYKPGTDIALGLDVAPPNSSRTAPTSSRARIQFGRA